MNQNTKTALLAILVVAVGVLGYLYYAETQKSDSVELKVQLPGVSIEKK
jgi:hypothetical protein